MSNPMSNHDKEPIPAGYWQDAEGKLVPVAKIKDIDKLRHKAVTDLCEQAKLASAQLAGFKLAAVEAVDNFVATSLELYGAGGGGKKIGGKKGNVSLTSFDGRYQIKRAMADTIVFDERLQAAKVLIDECITGWSKGSNANIKVLVNDAFQVDKQGNISTGRVLGLRALAIEDAQWLQAMQAIADSMKVVSTKAYVRFYERDEASGEYQPINLDVAAL